MVTPPPLMKNQSIYVLRFYPSYGHKSTASSCLVSSFIAIIYKDSDSVATTVNFYIASFQIIILLVILTERK